MAEKSKTSPQSPSSCTSLVSSTSINKTCTPSMLEPNENLGDASKDEEEDEASFILVGCTKCYMYMLVPQDNPRCLICQNRVLIHKFK
ncbi:hypothetical protein Lal_00041960 [Lupinus albus]|nr:hypothetical protein Lal_00041960 [Lupinus albus]